MRKFNNALKNRLVAAGMVVTLAVGMTACGSAAASGESERTTESEKQPTNISVVLDSNMITDDETLQDLQSKFSSYDITVKDVSNSPNMSVDEFTAQGVTTYLSSYSKLIADKDSGKYADISGETNKRGYDKTISETIKSMITDKQEHIVAVPTPYMYSLALICNVDMFQSAGIVDEAGTVKLPSTWDEVAEDARLIKENTGHAGFGFIGKEDVTGAWHFENMAWNFKADPLCLTNSDGSYQANIDSNEVISAMEYLKSLKWEKNVLTDTPENEDFNTLIEKVAKGEVAMSIGATDCIGFYSAYGMSDDSLAVTAVPAVEGAMSYSMLDGSVVTYSSAATSEQISAAMDCAEYLGYSPVLNAASQKELEAAVSNAYLKNAYVFGKMDSLVNPEIAKYKYETLAQQKGVEVKIDTPAFANAKQLDNFRNDAVKQESELYLTLSKAVENVLKDDQSDVKGLLDSANENYQKLLENE